MKLRRLQLEQRIKDLEQELEEAKLELERMTTDEDSVITVEMERCANAPETREPRALDPIPPVTKERFIALLEAAKLKFVPATDNEEKMRQFLGFLLPAAGLTLDEGCLEVLKEVWHPRIVHTQPAWLTNDSLPCWYSKVDLSLITDCFPARRYFHGAVALDGKVYCCPWDSNVFIVYDPSGGTLTAHDIAQVTPSRYARFSRMCALDGKLYAAPCVSDVMLIFDPASDSLSGVDIASFSCKGGDKFSGVCGLDGKVYMTPGHGDYLLVYDTQLGTVSGVDVTSVAQGSDKFSGACVCHGKIYGSPCNSDKLLVYDPASGSMSGIDVTGIVIGPSKFFDALSFAGKVYFGPCSADALVIYDPELGELRSMSIKHFCTGSGKFSGICALGGKIYLTPCNAHVVLVYTPEWETFVSIDLSSLFVASVEHLFGACALDGCLYVAGRFESYMLVLGGFDPWERVSKLEAEEATREAQLEARMKCKAASLGLGVSLQHLLKNFVPEALELCPIPCPSFVELVSHYAMGSTGKGKGNICPRDWRPDCSVVDALSRTHSGQATHFLSWCWGYKVHDFHATLQLWSEDHAELKLDGTFIWVCFFCNNQYRILEEQTQTGSDALEETFKTRLLTIGRVLIMLDSALEPYYIKRVWCVYETFMAVSCNVPTEALLPPLGRTQLHEAVRDGMQQVKCAFDAIDVEKAEASHKEDEDHVKHLIKQTSGGFPLVKEKVREHLARLVKQEIGKFLGAG
ncbi:unnamed protein product [Polarella glacialis]|uniref:Uncharacterized protein n=1 Tax=Polarella glacialis TaxID=89957 RepID=A0A813EP38_POLGL|nr:unnamed protein product [Polarella glacialis]